MKTKRLLPTPPPFGWTVLVVTYLILVVLILSSCTTAHKLPAAAPTDTTHNTTRIEYRDRLQRDSIFIRDSVFVRQSSDTVFITRFRDLYKERIKLDTCYLLNEDTVYIVRRVYVKEPLTRAEQTKITIGEWAIRILSVLIFFVMAYFIIRHFKM